MSNKMISLTKTIASVEDTDCCRCILAYETCSVSTEKHTCIIHFTLSKNNWWAQRTSRRHYQNCKDTVMGNQLPVRFLCHHYCGG